MNEFEVYIRNYEDFYGLSVEEIYRLGKIAILSYEEDYLKDVDTETVINYRIKKLRQSTTTFMSVIYKRHCR